jgi:hypothetical protein
VTASRGTHRRGFGCRRFTADEPIVLGRRRPRLRSEPWPRQCHRRVPRGARSRRLPEAWRCLSRPKSRCGSNDMREERINEDARGQEHQSSDRGTESRRALGATPRLAIRPLRRPRGAAAPPCGHWAASLPGLSIIQSASTRSKKILLSLRQAAATESPPACAFLRNARQLRQSGTPAGGCGAWTRIDHPPEQTFAIVGRSLFDCAQPQKHSQP